MNKPLVKVSVVRIAAIVGDLGDGFRGGLEKIRRALDLHLIDILDGRRAEFLIEQTDDIVFTVMEFLAKIREGGDAPDVLIDVFGQFLRGRIFLLLLPK